MKILATSLLAAFLCGCSLGSGRDRNGQLPSDVVTGFIAAVQADDFDKAKTFFTRESVNEIEHRASQRLGFRSYCEDFKGVSMFEFGPLCPGKDGYKYLSLYGRKNGNTWGRSFYFDRVDNRWLLIESENSYFWRQPKAEEPHAVLRITSYRFNDVRSIPGNTHGVGILLHRIDGDRAIPGHPVLADDDGSFTCRISPGPHELEYEEIKGQKAAQDIRYVTTTQVFAAGSSYTISGYSVTTNGGSAQTRQP